MLRISRIAFFWNYWRTYYWSLARASFSSCLSLLAISKSYLAMYLLMLIATLFGPCFAPKISYLLGFLRELRFVPSAMKIIILGLIFWSRNLSSIRLYFIAVRSNYCFVFASSK